MFCSNIFCILCRIMYDLYKYVFSFALSFSRMLCPKLLHLRQYNNLLLILTADYMRSKYFAVTDFAYYVH